MLSPEQVESFNESLLMYFGRRFDRPKYRLVWSSSQIEQRYVDGKEFCGNIYLREVKGITTVKKYPRDNERWILEILVEIPEALREELVGDRGLTYEPLWIFKDKQGTYQEPDWMALKFLAYLSHYPIEQAIINISEEIQKQDEREVKFALDMLNNEMPDICIALKRGSAVSYGGIKRLGNAILID